MKNYLCIALTCLLLIGIGTLEAQDADHDGINDQLEAALARRFAPEWRFHKHLDSPGYGSNQNLTEMHYPSSIEWFYNYVARTTGQPPKLWHVPSGGKSSITNISQLGSMTVPNTGLRADDPAWGAGNNRFIRLSDYPEKIPGDPHGFATYFRCYRTNDGMISIGYFLFYPQDYKGRYWVAWDPIYGNHWTEPAKHRGDWEGINILVGGVNNLNDPNEVINASLVRVKYSGHGVQKYIEASSPRFRSVHETHPKVYIAFGAHAPYPEPGAWTEYKVGALWGIFNINYYDDYFHGNGLVVQSWQPSRSLINLGETQYPLVGWLNYKGWWGPDDNGENSSPPSPPCKSPWTANIDKFLRWEDALKPENYSKYWEKPFSLDFSPELAAEYSPDPHYNCDIYVDCRVTGPGENPPLPTVGEGVIKVPKGGNIGIFPGHYPEKLTISKAMTLKAIEGLVVVGK